MTGVAGERRTLTIGTRGSKLALIQTELVRAALLAQHPDLTVNVERITTRGDVILDQPLAAAAINDKGLFIGEIEAALRDGRIDLAVHSAKDLPSALPPDLTIACFRVAQEALTNVVRHAQARHVWIELSQSDSALELAVRDDGVGFEVGPTQQEAFRRGRLGLLGMAERTQLLGGALHVESEPGRGACIRASFPTCEAPDEPAESRE